MTLERHHDGLDLLVIYIDGMVSGEEFSTASLDEFSTHIGSSGLIE